MPKRSENRRSGPMHSMRSQTLAAQSTTRACFATISDRSSRNVLRLRTTMSKGCRHGACCSSMRAAVSLSLYFIEENVKHSSRLFCDFCCCVGQEDYNRLGPFSYRGADVSLLAFSLISKPSFENIAKKPTVDIKTVLSQPMERLSNYAVSGSEVFPEFLQVEAFAKLSNAIGKIALWNMHPLFKERATFQALTLSLIAS